MTLQHTDPNRKPPQYCATPCPLCMAAAHMQLTKERQLVDGSKQIRDMRPGQIVTVDSQLPVVKTFLLLAGVPVVTIVPVMDAGSKTPTIDPARDP